MDYKGSVLCADLLFVLTVFAFCSQLQPGDCLVIPVFFPCACMLITRHQEAMNAAIVTDRRVPEKSKHIRFSCSLSELHGDKSFDHKTMFSLGFKE